MHGHEQPLPTGWRQQTANKKPNNDKPRNPRQLPQLVCCRCRWYRLRLDQSQGVRCASKYHGQSADQYVTGTTAKTSAWHESSDAMSHQTQWRHVIRAFSVLLTYSSTWVISDVAWLWRHVIRAFSVLLTVLLLTLYCSKDGWVPAAFNFSGWHRIGHRLVKPVNNCAQSITGIHMFYREIPIYFTQCCLR